MVDKNDNCIFCKIIRKEIKENFVDESNSFIAIFDKFPTVKGHVLVISKKHYVTLLDLPDRIGEELLSFTKKICGKILEEKFGDGFNIAMNNLAPAGQVVMHAHLHIFPRKENDGLKFFEKH